MTLQHPRSGGFGHELSQLSFGETVAGIVVALPILGALPLLLRGVRSKVWDWLVGQHVVVPDPAVAIAGGFGLDVYRLLVIAGVLGLVITAVFETARRRHGLAQITTTAVIGRR